MSPKVGMFSCSFFLAVSFLQVLFLIICHMGIVLPASDIHFYIIPFFSFVNTNIHIVPIILKLCKLVVDFLYTL